METRLVELMENITQTETKYEEYLKTQIQAEKDKSVVNITNVMSDEALKKIMYDAIERVNVIDHEHIEIIWKFDDLFSAA